MKSAKGLSTKLGVLVAFAGLIMACGGDDSTSRASSAADGATSPTSVTSVAALRCDLGLLFFEHVSLAANVTGSVLGGRNGEFTAAAGAFDLNSVDIAKMIGSVYGPQAEEAFLDGWRRHIGFFVDYTQGVAGNDQAKKDKAVADLRGYGLELGDLLYAVMALPKDDVVKLIWMHADGLTQMIDAQAKGDQVRAYELLRETSSQMQIASDAIAEATIQKFPDKFQDPPTVARQ